MMDGDDDDDDDKQTQTQTCQKVKIGEMTIREGYVYVYRYMCVWYLKTLKS